MAFDKWTIVRILEVIFSIACLICKRMTDEEAARLFLYLQKMSREWSLLNNVTWGRIGAALGDAAYGGYVIISIALLIGKLAGELPTAKRAAEITFLLIGATLFIILGTLELASLDAVPPQLEDNAAMLGILSLFTAALFVLDLGAPKARPSTRTQSPLARMVSSKSATHQPPRTSTTTTTPHQPQTYAIESELADIERRKLEEYERHKMLKDQNGQGDQNGFRAQQQNGYHKMKEGKPRPKRFDIYGKDGDATDGSSKTVGKSEEELLAERHSPVWSQIRKGQYGKYDIVAPQYLYPKSDSPQFHEPKSPSSPSDPGFVQFTAKTWGQKSPGTPRHSPTDV